MAQHLPAELRRHALATLFPGFEGTSAPPEWVRRLAADGLGGVVLFGRNVDPSRGDAGVAGLTAALRDAAPDILVAIDEEGGDVTRLDAAHGSSLPGNAALGAIDDLALTAGVAGELGQRLRVCGIDVNFAPVADVDAHAANPVIGPRSFGVDAELVARHVAAFVAGLQEHGVAATVKHFPGHGGTEDDSHLTTPVLDVPADRLHRTELPPFRAAIKADVQVVMTAHMLVPALDSAAPATVSPTIITGLLREELAYGGVVITDGLDMHAMSLTYGRAEAAVQALRAGVDALCIGGDSTESHVVEEIATAVVQAVMSGRLTEARLVEAGERLQALRHWVRVTPPPARDNPAAVRAARRAVTVHGDVGLAVPPLVVELCDEPSLAAGHVPWGIGAPLVARLPGTLVVRVTEQTTDVASVISAHPARRPVLCARGLRRREWQARAVRNARAARPDLIVVDHDVGSPAEVLGEHYVLTHGAARVTAEAAADVLAGPGE